MPQSYAQLFYHIVWATKERAPLLTNEVLRVADAAIRQKGSEIGAVTQALNGVADHVHMAVRLPAKLSVAQYLEEVKGYASYLIDHDPRLDAHRYWQPGYGAVTFRKCELPIIVRYIQRQKEHHAAKALWVEFERFED